MKAEEIVVADVPAEEESSNACMPSEQPLVEEKRAEVVAEVVEESMDISISCDAEATNAHDPSDKPRTMLPSKQSRGLMLLSR